jgi:hypothetical protein
MNKFDNRANKPLKSPKADTSITNKPVQSTSSTASPFSKRNVKKAPPPKSKLSNYLLGVIVAVVLIVVALFIIAPWNSTGSGDSPIPVGSDPNAKIEEFPSEGNDHVAPGTKVQYRTNPPTSGNHYPAWSDWGVFDTAPADETLVHNLEHGGIVIFYDCPKGCPSAKNSLAGYANRYDSKGFTGIMLVPRSNMPEGARIALVSWQNRMLLQTLDVNKINDFVAKRLNKGREADPNFRS